MQKFLKILTYYGSAQQLHPFRFGWSWSTKPIRGLLAVGAVSGAFGAVRIVVDVGGRDRVLAARRK
jgi:hypothetical protein